MRFRRIWTKNTLSEEARIYMINVIKGKEKFAEMADVETNDDPTYESNFEDHELESQDFNDEALVLSWCREFSLNIKNQGENEKMVQR